ncbi:MAG: hypothetical protein AAGC60_07720 [Acidobacteriota bacterium]
MASLCPLFGRLATAFLVSMAMAGLVVPPEVVAQSRIQSQVEALGLSADTSILIEILEFDSEAGLPSHFTISNDAGQSASVELTDDGYAWQSFDDPSVSGVQEIPGLDQTLSWKIHQDGDGFFEAEMPYDSFGATVEQHFKAGQSVSTYGSLDTESKIASLAAIDSTGVVADVTVDFSAIDGELMLAGNWSAGTGDSKAVVTISIATLLILLGVATIACGLISYWCWLACNMTCEHGVDRVITSNCGTGCTCECNDAPGCGATTPTGFSTMSIDDDAPAIPMPKSAATTLTRLEPTDELHHGEPISYLLGEWAVLSIGGGDAPKILRASSTDFAQGKAAALEQSLKSAPVLEPTKTLIVEYPLHPENERKIDMPDLVLRPTLAPSSLTDGRVMVRADFQHRHLARLDVLDSNVDVAPEGIAWLKSSLDLEFHSEENHRVVTFAVLEIDGGSLKVVETFQYLPKCCSCLGPIC